MTIGLLPRSSLEERNLAKAALDVPFTSVLYQSVNISHIFNDQISNLHSWSSSVFHDFFSQKEKQKSCVPSILNPACSLSLVLPTSLWVDRVFFS